MAADHSTPLSRRTVLSRAVAAAPAVALASMPAIAAATVSPDAELIALGREIEALLPRYTVVCLESCVRGWKARELAAERSGWNKRSGTIPETEEEIKAVEAVYAAAMKEEIAAEIELGCDAWDTENERLTAEETRLVNAVTSLPAKTPEGVRVKSLAVALVGLILIAHDPDTLGWDEFAARDLALAVLAERGIKVPEHLISAVAVKR